MLSLLIKYNWQNVQRYFQTRKTAKLVTIALFALIFLLIAVGIYLFFKEGFYYIGSDHYFREAFSLYVYEMYLLVFVSLVVFSTFISAVFALFRRKHDDWLVSAPGFAVLPRFIFLRVSASSLWPLFIIVLPALLAIRQVYALDGVGLILVFLCALVLNVFVVLLVLLVALSIGKAMLVLARRTGGWSVDFKKILAGFILCVAVLMFFTWHGSINRDLIELFGAEDLTAVQASVDAIAENFKYQPSHFVAAALYSWQSSHLGYVVSNLSALTLLTAVLLFLWWRSSGWFLDLWKSLQDGSRNLQGRTNRKRPRRPVHFPASVLGVLLKKEALVFRRDLRGLMWLGFLFFVWFLQSVLNSMLSQNIIKYGLDLSALPHLVFVLQFVTGIYFISAFVLRFAFPTFGSEQKSAWLIATAPIHYARLFWAKLWFFASLFSVLGVIIVSVNLSYFGVSLFLYGQAMLIFMVAVIWVVVYGLYLGAMYPNFETDDPAALSTSLPGLSFMAGALLYGALGGAVLYQAYVKDGLWLAGLFVSASLLLAIYLAQRAARQINKTEFVKLKL